LADRPTITAVNYEGEGVTDGAGFCHGPQVSFSSPQDHACSHLIHVLYAPRKAISGRGLDSLKVNTRSVVCETGFIEIDEKQIQP